eukprot:566227-Pyramimonas_sp.AAC.1
MQKILWRPVFVGGWLCSLCWVGPLSGSCPSWRRRRIVLGMLCGEGSRGGPEGVQRGSRGGLEGVHLEGDAVRWDDHFDRVPPPRARVQSTPGVRVGRLSVVRAGIHCGGEPCATHACTPC